MKRKFIVLLLAVFLLTGCSATVDINLLNGGNVDESITIDFPVDNDYYTKDLVKNSFRNYYPAFYQNWIADSEKDFQRDNVKYYVKTIQETTNGYKFNYKYTYTLDEYINASTLNIALGSTKFNVREQSNYIEFTSLPGIQLLNTYSNLDSVTVNIKTNYTVLASSADYVNNNVYTWVFNKTNNSTKSIYFKFEYNRNNLAATMVEDIIDNNGSRTGAQVPSTTNSYDNNTGTTVSSNGVYQNTTSSSSSNDNNEDTTKSSSDEITNKTDSKKSSSSDDSVNEIFKVLGIIFLIALCIFVLFTLNKMQSSKLR